MLYILTAIAFVIGVALVLGSYFGVTKVPGMMLQRKLDARLQEISLPDAPAESDGSSQGLLKTAQTGMLPALDKMMAGTAKGSAVSRWLEQSGVKISVSTPCCSLAIVCGGAFGFLGLILVKLPIAFVLRRRRWASRCRSSSST